MSITGAQEPLVSSRSSKDRPTEIAIVLTPPDSMHVPCFPSGFLCTITYVLAHYYSSEKLVYLKLFDTLYRLMENILECTCTCTNDVRFFW